MIVLLLSIVTTTIMIITIMIILPSRILTTIIIMIIIIRVMIMCVNQCKYLLSREIDGPCCSAWNYSPDHWRIIPRCSITGSRGRVQFMSLSVFTTMLLSSILDSTCLIVFPPPQKSRIQQIQRVC